MSRRVDHKKKSELIRKAARLAQARLPKRKAAQLADFLDLYYAHVPPQDVVRETPANLLGAAMAHWTLGAKRKPGRVLVRVYKPNVEDYGWDSPHTVIEVVNDDMPFLVDSVTAALNRLDLAVHLVVHPTFKVRRAKDGRLTSVHSPHESGLDYLGESFMRFEISEQPKDRFDEIRAAVLKVLADVRAAVEDWLPMRDKLAAIINELETFPPPLPSEEVREVKDFLRWVHENHFTLLGYRDYHLTGTGAQTKATLDRASGLGVLRDPKVFMLEELRHLAAMPPKVRSFVGRRNLLMLTKTNTVSTVHRPVLTDFIGIKRFDAKGRVTGLRVFVGLFTSVAYNRSPRDIPLLRDKVQRVFARAGFAPDSHTGKALMHILETFPRDELFQVSDAHLLSTSEGILHLQDRQRVALFVRRDIFERFITCLIYVPRDSYTTDLRLRMQAILEKAFDGKVTHHHAALGDAPQARLYLTVRTRPGRIPPYNTAAIEARLAEEARSWGDQLQEALGERLGEREAVALMARYRDAFPPGYRDRFDAPTAVEDIGYAEQVLKTGALALNLYRADGLAKNRLNLKLYNLGGAIALSDVLPMLEHMGLRVLDEVPHAVLPATGDDETLIVIHDFGLETAHGAAIDLAAVRDIFEEALHRVWRGEVESDRFNALVLLAGLAWREVAALRAFSKYLRQARIPFSQTYMQRTLIGNPKIARLIAELFLARFDPARKKDSKRRIAALRRRLSTGLNAVVSADEDRILRRFVNLVEVMLRTNYFQTDEHGEPKAYLSFKLDSCKVDGLPLPRPFREIFVYSPRVEGVHLRFGMVARGGLRWSDRPEDFRTEVLGLVKAQQVKNAVIVPVGSKGGFVVKRPPVAGGREAFMAEGIACYKTLVSGLLDLTDNLKEHRVVAPPDVVRLDADDPYLVVAADKGTATFSDIANSISKRYGFWLGDAFASGGSAGYDHKKIGITARGAWESVKRHFREIGVDIQRQDFTVIGIGDMSGDVFGNGMLLSRHIKLLGAFNHLHIFVDPNPDPATSLKERKRLFRLPRSSWADYNADLISRGGGVFARTAKTITLTPEIKKRFAITQNTLTPNELIRALLTAEADLLWFGGIGTYVKASDESHGDVGDRANDGVRVDAGTLRAKVVGEGANLGITQRGRIEYALKGGRGNTDAIDNSAGVDCSDHEVNIKILVDSAVAKGKLNQAQRNRLLAGMTDEVAALVLEDNYLQSQAITVSFAQGFHALDNQVRLMRMLERSGELNRAVEFLPDEEELANRTAAKNGLTRPEIAVLLAYAKNWLYAELLESDFPDDRYLVGALVDYFPTALHTKYRDAIERHRLRREIIATVLTNTMINRVGETFVSQFMEKTGASPVAIARAYTIASEVFVMDGLWQAVEALDNKVPASVQTSMLLDINHLIDWVTLWFLRNGERSLDIGTHVDQFRDGICTLADVLDDVLPAHYLADRRVRGRPYLDKGVPEALALRVAGLVNLFSGCDIVRLANRRGLPVPQVAKLYFAVGTRFRLGSLRAAASSLDSDSHWQDLAVAALVEEIYAHQLKLTNQVLDAADGRVPPDRALTGWAAAHRQAVDATDRLLAELWSSEVNDLSMIAVASRQLSALAGPS